MRASASYACDQLCFAIRPIDFPDAFDLLRQLLRNTNETPQIRRAAASGLEKLARRGYFSEEMLYDFLLGAQDRDLKVARSCILGLMRYEQDAAFEDLILLLQKFDRLQRKIVCNVYENQPTKTGLQLIAWLIENDKRSNITIESIHSLGKGLKIALNAKLDWLDDFVGDSQHIRNVSLQLLNFLNNELPQVVCGSLLALCEIFRIQKAKKVETLEALSKDILARTRSQLNHPEYRVQATACITLGFIGSSSDIALLSNLQSHSDSQMVRDTAAKNIDNIQRHLSKNIKKKIHKKSST